MRKLFLTLVFVTLCVVLFAETERYPARPVTVVVPYSAGGASDIMARLVAEFWKKYTGQEMVVTNVVGAEGAVAARQVKGTKPDGYTVLWYHQAMLGNYYLGVADINWYDFTPACVVTKTSRITATRADMPWKNLKDAIEDAKANPRKYVYGTGAGGIAYLEYAPVEVAARGCWRVVPNEGGDSQRIVVLLGNHVDIVPLALVSAVSYIKSGQIKPLVVHDVERDPFIPDVPSAAELGYPDLVFPMTSTFFFPPNTPKWIVEEFNKIMEKILNDAEFKAKLAEMAYATVFFKTGKDLEDFWKSQEEVYKKAAEVLK
ncbi:MAG: tripartite tricarboxylate transporter substrate binding protein [Thermotoga caldifontis]|uniref:tripartite tricarboxylate transporter substrate binding protein n=1 Tax=Thermotoga caldifontis TaxID=1508419 RepID=UPI003C7D5D0A